MNLLTGGVLAVPRVYAGRADSATNANSNYVSLNFNGGTLRALAGTSGSDASAFMNMTAAESVVVNLSNGGIIDTNSQNIAFNQPLLAPAGGGLSTLTVATNGTGYVGQPYVQIVGGGGIGATASAVMASDGTAAGTFKISSFVITNPGVNYTAAPSITLMGGGAVTAATIGTVAVNGGQNSGGITKAGNGVLTLTGVHTITGNSTVGAGTLLIDTPGVFSAPLTVNSGAVLGGTGTLSAATGVTVNAGGKLNPGDPATPGTLTLSGATSTLTMTNSTSALTFRLSAAPAGSDGALTNTPSTGNDFIDAHTGTVTMNGGTINVVGSGAFGAGFYRLILGQSFVAGTGTFAVGSMPAGFVGTLIVSGSSVDLQVSGAPSFTWTGGSPTTDHWTDGNNWGGTAPSGNLGEQLIFPSGAARPSNHNDFPTGTSFGSITFSGSGGTNYTIHICLRRRPTRIPC